MRCTCRDVEQKEAVGQGRKEEEEKDEKKRKSM
jgi:hypothetical protein